MKRFYFAGQTYFGNRGCEALVRATTAMLAEQFGEIEVLCPSIDAARDRAQWPQAEAAGVRFVTAPAYPSKLRWWYRIAKRARPVMAMYIPRAYALPPEVLADVRSCDAIIMIGGDNITLDYSPAGLIGNTAFSEMFMREKKPTVLWAASVGPFSREPAIERYMSDFLNRLDLLTVREPLTEEYLKSIGATKVMQRVADPAFLMVPEPFDVDACLPVDRGSGVLGLNFSPLVKKFSAADDKADEILARIERFIRGVLDEQELSVMLVPHVDPLDGSEEKSDSAYMRPLFDRLRSYGARISMAPRTLNAAQLKYLISRCRFFMGARTHSTIAGFSMAVPTVSIAYSVKARGLNRDIFGHERYIVSTKDLTEVTLRTGLDTIQREEAAIRSHLAEASEDLKRRARLSAAALASLLPS